MVHAVGFDLVQSDFDQTHFWFGIHVVKSFISVLSEAQHYAGINQTVNKTKVIRMILLKLLNVISSSKCFMLCPSQRSFYNQKEN